MISMDNLYRAEYKNGQIIVTELKIRSETKDYVFFGKCRYKACKETMGTVVGEHNKRVYSDDKYFAVAAMCDYLTGKAKKMKEDAKEMDIAVNNCIYEGAIEL